MPCFRMNFSISSLFGDKSVAYTVVRVLQKTGLSRRVAGRCSQEDPAANGKIGEYRVYHLRSQEQAQCKVSATARVALLKG